MTPRAVVQLVCALVLPSGAGCVVEQPCGWDEAIDVNAPYDITLVEQYSEASTTALYFEEHDLTRPAPTCGTLGDLAVGETWTINVLERPELRCSFYRGEVLSPPVELGTPISILINNRSHNMVAVSGTWDFGDGCRGPWELSIHSPGDNPFREQTPGTIPAVLAYRVFNADGETSNDACAALFGADPSEFFRCGDAFVARMEPASGP